MVPKVAEPVIDFDTAFYSQGPDQPHEAASKATQGSTWAVMVGNRFNG